MSPGQWRACGDKLPVRRGAGEGDQSCEERDSGGWGRGQEVRCDVMWVGGVGWEAVGNADRKAGRQAGREGGGMICCSQCEEKSSGVGIIVYRFVDVDVAVSIVFLRLVWNSHAYGGG